ncbi:MAG: glycosyltransferase, partial [Flavobacterium sp.]
KKFNSQEHALMNSLKKEKVDVILAEYGPTACASLAVAQHLEIPMLVHFHGYDASVYTIIEKYGEQYKKVFAYARAVIVVSNKMKAALIALECPADKIVISVYGPNPLYFQVAPTYGSQQFITVGRFVEKKAPNLTIIAFNKVLEKYPAAKLVMVGDGKLLEVCKKTVSDLGIEENVVFKGVQTSKQIQVLFQESIAFVQHSVIATDGDSEGTPVAILEAQAAALPVIATYHAGIPDVIINNETGFLVKEHEVESMSQNMLQILKEPCLAKIMGEAGRQRVLQNFTMKKHLNKIENVIDSSMK